ncbi:PREDICTED: uncharacterized protein LOC104820582 [Tarenaya hassleriana]|uniref:uncharacterized protein LOC104820582 n=1 Tax=Tarenaya hassleriana TaxID=28532 RepID=UPI00053CA83A|nr:PREDICTED: uncharacterized protein LOC104820582 [Tarenaya hassleriana]XP_010549387.1 PREDICTED: uncharacterized protein LOC104820582 [Tarenaya hassleriana]XP_010549388.1 PREDICTED: uncharacterized protein LOC104820582 [Tarenaya hassleriana]
MEEDTPPIFDHCLETSSQKSQLQRCGFAFQRDDHPDSQLSTGAVPPKNGWNSPRDVPGDSEKMVTDSERRPDTEDNIVALDRAVPVVLEEQTTVAEVFGPNRLSHEEGGSRVSEKPNDLSDQPLSSRKLKDGNMKSPAKENGKTKLKIPLREVVKAIVMNSRDQRNKEEEEKDLEKMDYVQILMSKGFKFPD